MITYLQGISKMKCVISLACLLVLVVGCQAQTVNPEPPIPTGEGQQVSSLDPILKRFDEIDKSNANVEQRITLVQEQIIKVNQQMQGLHQRNLQLLQALQQMQLSMTQITAIPKPVEPEKQEKAIKGDNEVNSGDLAQSEEQAASDQRALESAVKLEELIARLEQYSNEQKDEQLTEGTQVKEESDPFSADQEAAGFRLVSAYTPKGQWVIFKYDEQTGLTWNAQDGGWIEVEELESLPASVYQVVLRPASGDVKGYVAARIDRETGRSWWLRGNVWESFE